MTDRDDHEIILSTLAEGYSVGKAARVLGIPEDEVRAALTVVADNFRNGENLRRVWALEDWRLGQLGAKFFREAMSTEGGAAYQAAVAYCRISSRRAELCGANSPQSYSVTLMAEAAPPELTSTDRVEAAIDFVRGVSARERELSNRQSYSDEPLTADEQAELEQLRASREARRLAQLGRDPGSEPSIKPH